MKMGPDTANRAGGVLSGFRIIQSNGSLRNKNHNSLLHNKTIITQSPIFPATTLPSRSLPSSASPIHCDSAQSPSPTHPSPGTATRHIHSTSLQCHCTQACSLPFHPPFCRCGASDASCPSRYGSARRNRNSLGVIPTLYSYRAAVSQWGRSD